MLQSYSEIRNLGHPEINGLLNLEVNVEEKVDGSQFSFGIVDGELQFRSKAAVVYTGATPAMFKAAVEYVDSISSKLHEGMVYRGEVLSKPKHNSLPYDRVPRHNIIIFDVQDVVGNFCPYNEKVQRAAEIDLEVVPLLFYGKLTLDKCQELLDVDSILGGQKIEGIVVKPTDYNFWGRDGKVLMGKFVSERFKEVHKTTWRIDNPGQTDILQLITNIYRTEARWDKAVIHLSERGELTNSPKDIGPLIRAVNVDVLKECTDEIKEELFKWAWKKISHQLTGGLPEYYKNRLMVEGFHDNS